MGKKYSAGKKTNIIFFFIILMLLCGPYLGTMLHGTGGKDKYIVLIVLYGAYAPLIILLIIFFRKYLTGYILVSKEGLTLKYRKDIEKVAWTEISSVSYDYILMSSAGFTKLRYSVIYEICYSDSFFRFNSLADENHPGRDDSGEIHAFNRRTFAFESYGLYFNKKDAADLVHDIEKYSRKTAYRQKDLFYEENSSTLPQ